MLTSTLTQQAHPKRRIDTPLTLEKGAKYGEVRRRRKVTYQCRKKNSENILDAYCPIKLSN